MTEIQGDRPFRVENRPAEQHGRSAVGGSEVPARVDRLASALSAAAEEGVVWTPILDRWAATGHWPETGEVPAPEEHARSMLGWVTHQDRPEALYPLVEVFGARAPARLVAAHAHALDDRIVEAIAARPALLAELARNPNLGEAHAGLVLRRALSRLESTGRDEGIGETAALDAVAALRALLQADRETATAAMDAILERVMVAVLSDEIDTPAALDVVTAADPDRLSTLQLVDLVRRLDGDRRGIRYLFRELGRRPRQLARWLDHPAAGDLHEALLRLDELHGLLEEPRIRSAVRRSPSLRALQFFARTAREEDLDDLVEHLLEHLDDGPEARRRVVHAVCRDLRGRLRRHHLEQYGRAVDGQVVDLLDHPEAGPTFWVQALRDGPTSEVARKLIEVDRARRHPEVRAELAAGDDPDVLEALLPEATGPELRDVFGRLARADELRALTWLQDRLSEGRVTSLGAAALTPLLASERPGTRAAALSAIPGVEAADRPEPPDERGGEGRRGGR